MLTEIYIDQTNMGDAASGASNAAAKAVKNSPASQPGFFKRILELLMMMISAFLVIFAWDTAQKAQQESAELRQELRRARGEQADRSGTRCTVCLDQPREVLLQPCGHVCVCGDCSKRLRCSGNQCPICRVNIVNTQRAYIS